MITITNTNKYNTNTITNIYTNIIINKVLRISFYKISIIIFVCCKLK